MSTKIIDLPITKGIIVVVDVWKTKIKIKRLDKFFVINTPKDMLKASVGDVYMMEKIDYTTGGQTAKRIIAKKIQTTMIEMLPLKTKQEMKLIKRGNGLLKIKINECEYVIKESDTLGIDRIEEGGVIEVILDKGILIKYYEPISEDDLFT